MYHDEPGLIEFVADPSVTIPETEWYVKEYGGGVMVVEPKHFGRIFICDTSEAEDLVFVSRAELTGPAKLT